MSRNSLLTIAAFCLALTAFVSTPAGQEPQDPQVFRFDPRLFRIVPPK